MAVSLTFGLIASLEPYPAKATEISDLNCLVAKVGAKVNGTAQAVVVESIAPPELIVPPNITVKCSDSTDPSYTGRATATDNCDNNPVITFEDTVSTGSCPEEKVITRIWTAKDNCGNTSSAIQVITVVDTKAPTIYSLIASPAFLWPPNHVMIPVTITSQSIDNCDPSLRCKIISVESNQPEDACGDGHTEPDWEIVSDLIVNLRAERAGCRKEDRIYRITVECIDCSGNRNSQVVEVKVTHDLGEKNLNK